MPVVLSWAAEDMLSFCGELDAAGLETLGHELMQMIPSAGGRLQLDLLQLDLLDTGSVLGMHKLLRSLANRFRPLIILHAPQILAHTLYRAGDLQRPGLSLVEPRQEEPYG